MSAGALLRRLLPALAAIAAGTAARAQDVPQVVSPLRVETDHNNVNLVDGETTIEPPALTVPGAPNLRWDRAQNAAPYVVGEISDAESGTFSVHIGAAASESFRCTESGCDSVTGSGSTFNFARFYRQAGTGARWHFNRRHFNTIGPPHKLQYYADHVDYPNGETIRYTYQTGALPVDPLNRTFYRPIRISSNFGYYVEVTYPAGPAVDTPGWGSPTSATIYASGSLTPLGRLTYNAGGSITRYGENDQAPRTYVCTGCSRTLGADLEVSAGSMQLPTESAPTLQATAVPDKQLVQTVTRDGVAWTYNYTYQGGPPVHIPGPGFNYRYDRLDITGPNGFNRVYRFTFFEQRNVLASVTDSLGRLTSYQFDPGFRPTQITSPEGNRVNVVYDGAGNVFQRTTTPKAGSGLAPVTESATYTIPDGDPHFCDVSCWRPTSSRDGLNRQTDYLYNPLGQLTEQTDPADAAGVRRRTIVDYALSLNGISRRIVVRICPAGALPLTCAAGQQIRTEYQYRGDTNLVTRERRIDPATQAVLDTLYAYDPAGNLTMTDGPLSGTGDATYNRYDPNGRRTWEIGAIGGNGLRLATRTAYRDSDDKVTSVETGTVPDQDSTTLTVISRVDYAYDARRNPERETVFAGGTAQTLVQRTFDASSRLDCEARRMNPAAFATLPPSACALGATGTQGPDRITHNIWDAEGQLITEQRAYATSLQQNYASYSYSPNGRRTSVTDANNNRAEMIWDGFDRQRRWIFPSPTAPGQANPNDYEEYGYDAVGNRTSLRKRDNWPAAYGNITYQYDNLNRLILKVVPARPGLPPTHTRDVHYGYDLRNLQLFARFDSAAGEGVTNAYDPFGRLITSTTNMDGVSRALAYQYDAGSRRTRITFPDSAAFNATYHPSGQANALTDPVGSAIVAYSYNPAGLPSALGRPGSTSGFQYDPLGRLTSLSHYIGAPLDVQWTFAHNPASQITTRTRSNDDYAATAPADSSRGYSAAIAVGRSSRASIAATTAAMSRAMPSKPGPGVRRSASR